jgi:hypothetical protein
VTLEGVNEVPDGTILEGQGQGQGQGQV